MSTNRVSFNTSKAGTINCDVLGDLSTANAVILTVHDLGCNSTSWTHFVEHPSMTEVTKRAVWLHVNFPGQEDGADSLPKGSQRILVPRVNINDNFNWEPLVEMLTCKALLRLGLTLMPLISGIFDFLQASNGLFVGAVGSKLGKYVAMLERLHAFFNLKSVESVTDYKYPSLDTLAEALGEVCADVHCPVIGLGEGAGANVLARWALSAPKQLHGAVLIHCTSTTAGFLESMKDKAINWKLLGGMNPTAENYLIMHRFGDFSHAENAEQVKKVVDEFHEKLNSSMNSANLSGYIDSFVHRTNIAEKMSALTVPLLIITGAKASHNHTVHTFYNATLKAVADRKKVEFVEVVNIANVVEGAPEKLAESMQFFMQGCGVLGGAPMPHVSSSSHKAGATMEDLDRSGV